MARNVNPLPQFLDGNGVPYSGGKMYYYESGTTTLKTTYSDVDEGTPNTNPVILDADGRLGDVFFSGVCKQVLKTSADVQVFEADPVGGTDTLGPFGDWNALTLYADGAIVTRNDLYYQSEVSANQGNDPATDTTNWSPVKFYKTWTTSATYAQYDLVQSATNGLLYTSQVGSNQGNDPTTDAVNWTLGAQNNDLTLINAVSGYYAKDKFGAF